MFSRNDRRGASYLAGARDIELPSLADTAARLHASPIAKLPFARDLPRLCGKVWPSCSMMLRVSLTPTIYHALT